MEDAETTDVTTTKRQYKLRIGSTFMETTNKSNLYNTIKFDFTPASCNSARNMHLYCQGGDSVLVGVPNDESEYTFFKGSKKPSPKECILIIDHETNTATLERISNNFAVKRTKIMDDSVLKLLPPLEKKKLCTPHSTNPKPLKKKHDTVPPSLSDKDKQDLSKQLLYIHPLSDTTLVNDLMISESDD